MAKGYTFAIVSMLIALIYATLPIATASLFSIDPMVLLFICWCFFNPSSPPPLLVAWSLGLVQDLLMGSVFGVHAFSLSITVYMILKLFHRMQFFALWQQVLCVGCLTLVNQLMLALFAGFQGHFANIFIVISPAVMTMSIWLILGYAIVHTQGSLP